MKAPIIAVNSQVAYGHVGNSAAVFALERLGHEVWPLPTVLFSNHPGHGEFEGEAVPAAKLGALLKGLGRRGALARCGAVHSGYLGAADQGEVVADAVAGMREGGGAGIYACDPVLGDAGRGLYVAEDVAALVRARLVPLADIVTPNRFELGYLTDRGIAGERDALGACRQLIARGPRVVVCTSLEPVEDPERGIVTLAVTEAGAWRVGTPALDTALHGAGDLLAALFLGRYLEYGDAAEALGRAVSSTYGILEASLAAGADELVLIEAQDQIVRPRRLFAVERMD